MLFLDEPSAAVDAGAKRHLWKVIKARAPDQYLVMKRKHLNHESYVNKYVLLTSFRVFLSLECQEMS